MIISVLSFTFVLISSIVEFSPQVPKETPASTERPVRVAYLLSLNGRGVRQVRRLFKMLFHQDHYFYIHVDAVCILKFKHCFGLPSHSIVPSYNPLFITSFSVKITFSESCWYWKHNSQMLSLQESGMLQSGEVHHSCKCYYHQWPTCCPPIGNGILLST